MKGDLFRYVSVSGGKDSTACYILAIKKYGKKGFRAVFADTGHEHPVTVNYVKNMHKIFKGPMVEIVRACFSDRLLKRGKKTSKLGELFQDLIVWKGRAPSTKAQFCTEHLKLQPIRDWIIKNRKDKPSIGYVGIRWEESKRRSEMPKELLNEYMDSLTIHPIIEWKEREVLAFIKDYGELNPLYGQGYSRVGCFPCIHARKRELGQLPQWAWERLTRYEKAVGRSWFSSGILPGTRGTKEIPEIEDVKAWAKTKWGGKVIDPEIEVRDVPSCMATWGVCE